jgi:hypothetical protein
MKNQKKKKKKKKNWQWLRGTKPVVQEPHALQVSQDILAVSEISKFYYIL